MTALQKYQVLRPYFGGESERPDGEVGLVDFGPQVPLCHGLPHSFVDSEM